MYCPRCNSDQLIRHGWQWRLKDQLGRPRKRLKVQRYRCKDCGHFTVYPSLKPSVV